MLNSGDSCPKCKTGFMSVRTSKLLASGKRVRYFRCDNCPHIAKTVVNNSCTNAISASDGECERMPGMNETSHKTKQFLTLAETSRVLSLTAEQIAELIWRGQFPRAIEIDGRLMFSAYGLSRWLEMNMPIMDESQADVCEQGEFLREHKDNPQYADSWATFLEIFCDSIPSNRR